MKNFKAQFPGLKSKTYLDTAASGLLSEDVFEFRQEYDLDFLISGSGLKAKQDEILLKTRGAVGALFHCPATHIALTPNFSYGFSTLLTGIDASKKILLLKDDYPAINLAVEAKGFETCTAIIDENLEENIEEAVKKHQPDVFAFSLVQYLNGIKIDFDFLKSLKNKYPELLIIADGTQYCGTEKFNFSTSGIDVLGTSAYKWLNAGFGNAFYMFSETALKNIHPKTVGPSSYQDKYKAKGSLTGNFEPGHMDAMNFGSLLTAIVLINKTGLEHIEKQIKSLAAEAKKELQDLNLLEPAVVHRSQHSSIFNIKGDDALFQYLRNKKIICSPRGSGIRVGFHAFNTLEDLEHLVQTLHSYRK